MKTVFPKDNAKWYLVDAKDKVLGRLATEIATVLRGKHKPSYSPHMSNGDFVIVVNAEQVMLTGNKNEDKYYYKHSGFPGGMKAVNAAKQRELHPEDIIKDAVWGMLPKNALSKDIHKRLKVFRGESHPHDAQKPEVLNINA